MRPGPFRAAVLRQPLRSGTIYRVVLLIGQSNMCGRGALTVFDRDHPRVKQFPDILTNTATYRQMLSSTLPLYHPEDNVSSNYAGPGNGIGKAIAISLPTDEVVLLVPCAWGGTSIVSGTARWSPGNPGGNLYEDAIAQANAAVYAAKAANPQSSFHSFHWVQGEADGDGSVSQATYFAALSNVIAGMRSRVAGAGSAPFVIGSMVPEAIAGRAGYSAIDAAHKQVAASIAGVKFVPGVPGQNNGETPPLHYNRGGALTMGYAMGQAVIGADLVARDTFTGVDNTALTARDADLGLWAQKTGSPNDGGILFDNRLVITSASRYIFTNNAVVGDYAVSAKFFFASVKTSETCVLMGRWQAGSTVNSYGVRWNAGSSSLDLVKIISSTTNLASMPFTPTPGQAYRVVLDMRGSTLRMLADLNDGNGLVQRAIVTDSTLSSGGGVGFYQTTASTTTTGMHYDDIEVSTAAI